MRALFQNAGAVVLGGTIIAILAFRAPQIEGAIAPCMGPFEIEQIEPMGEVIEISGVLDKRSDCPFIGVSAYGVSAAGELDRLRITFHDTDGESDPTRQPGRQPWGPWRIERPHDNDTLKLIVRHQSPRGWWRHTTVLAEISPEDL